MPASGLSSTNFPNHQPNLNSTSGAYNNNNNNNIQDPSYNNTASNYNSQPPQYPSSGNAAGQFTSGIPREPTLPPTNTNTDYPDLKAAKKEARSGKMQHTMGSILHAPGMKAKGDAKMEHAQMVELQAAHLDEAQALEEQAKIHRERAEAHAMAVGNNPGPYASAANNFGANA